MTPLVIGVLGMVLIILGWISSASVAPPLRLSVLYALGSLFLLIYSYLIRDPVFTVLNGAALVASGYNIYLRVVR